MNCTINIFGPYSTVTGDVPISEVAFETSYFEEGAKFVKAYKMGTWDGRKHLFNKRSGAFPTGLLSTVKRVCEEAGAAVEIVDHRMAPRANKDGFELHGVSMTGKYDYQMDACKAAVEKKQGIIKIATGGGKCLKKGTLIRMADGSTQKVENIQVGDQVMGPDSKPRTVLGTTTGTGPLYEITPNRGTPWVCNDAHILTLEHTVTGEWVDISVTDYPKQHQTFKHCHKHFSVGVEYPHKDVAIEPYLLGMWYGDGTKSLKGFDITTMDPEIVNHLEEQANKWNLSLRVTPREGNKSSVYSFSRGRSPRNKNDLLTAVRVLVHAQPGFPKDYLINSREVRLQFLAGLIDSDGHKRENRNSYEITFKNHAYAEDIFYLAKSLGYGSTISNKYVKKYPNNMYYRVNIMGVNPGDIPVKLARKQVNKPRLYSPTRRKFDVTPIGEGEYAGFSLDGDGRFLLADYTVTHNSNIAASVTKYLGLTTLIIVPTRELMHQTRDRFMKLFDSTDKSVFGVIGDGLWEPGSLVTIAITDTLEARINDEECIEFLSGIDLLFMDEAHRCGSETYFKVVMTCPAYYRFALSATPLDRTDGANLRILAASGDVLIDIPNKLLVDRGVTAKADIIWDKVAEPVLSTKQRYVHVYKQGVVENKVFAQRVVDWVTASVANGLCTVVMVEELEQGKLLDEMLWTETGKTFIPHQFIHGNETAEVRDKALRDFRNRELPCLIASRIMDEGVDLPNIEMLLLAGSRKSKIRTLQRLGRGLRGDRLIVVEFANYCHKYLIKHSLERLQDYKKEECFPIHQFKDGTDKAAMIKRLWDAQDKVNETRMAK